MNYPVLLPCLQLLVFCPPLGLFCRFPWSCLFDLFFIFNILVQFPPLFIFTFLSDYIVISYFILLLVWNSFRSLFVSSFISVNVLILHSWQRFIQFTFIGGITGINKFWGLYFSSCVSFCVGTCVSWVRWLAGCWLCTCGGCVSMNGVQVQHVKPRGWHWASSSFTLVCFLREGPSLKLEFIDSERLAGQQPQVSFSFFLSASQRPCPTY